MTVDIVEEMRTWIEEVTGAAVVHASRQAGGGRKEAWFIDVARPDGTTDELFLRWDQSDVEADGDPWTVRREAEIYRALSDTPVPVATFIAMHPTAQAMLATRVYGRNWFSQITDPDEAVAVAKDFMTHLAALHRIDVHDLGLPGVDPDVHALGWFRRLAGHDGPSDRHERRVRTQSTPGRGHAGWDGDDPGTAVHADPYHR